MSSIKREIREFHVLVVTLDSKEIYQKKYAAHVACVLLFRRL